MCCVWTWQMLLYMHLHRAGRAEAPSLHAKFGRWVLQGSRPKTAGPTMSAPQSQQHHTAAMVPQLLQHLKKQK